MIVSKYTLKFFGIEARTVSFDDLGEFFRVNPQLTDQERGQILVLAPREFFARENWTLFRNDCAELKVSP